MEKKLDIKIGAKDNASGPMAAVHSALRRLTGSFSHSSHGIMGMVGAGALLESGMIAAEVAVDALKDGLKETIGGAIAYQQQLTLLSTALAGVGDNTKTAMTRATQFADAVESQTTISRDAVMQAEKLGVTIGHFTGPALQTATKAAIGLAQKLNINVSSAMELVSRAARGQTTAFTRYGVTFAKGATAQEKFNQVIKDGLGGFALATASTKTLGGTFTQMKHIVLSTVQDALMPTIISISNIAREFLTKAKPAIMAFGQVIKAVVGAAWSIMKSFGSMVESVFGFSAGGMQTLLLRAAYAIKHWKDVVAIDILKAELFFVKLSNKIVYEFSVVIPTWLEWFGTNWKNLLFNYAKLAVTVWTNIAKNIVNIIKNIPGLIRGTVKFSSLWTPITEGFKSTLAKLPEIAKRAKGPLEQALGSAISSATGKYNSGLAAYLKKERAAEGGSDNASALKTGSSIAVNAPAVLAKAKHAIHHHIAHAVKHHVSRSHDSGPSAISGQSGFSLTGVAAAFNSAHQNNPAATTAKNTSAIASATSASVHLMQELVSTLGQRGIIAGVLS